MKGESGGYRVHQVDGLLTWMCLVVLTSIAFSVSAFHGSDDAVAAEPDGPFPLNSVFSFGPDGTEATDFNKLGSVALDQQDSLVYGLRETDSEATLFKFGADGQPADFEGINPDIKGNRIEGLEPLGPVLGTTISVKVAVDSASGVIYVVQSESVLAFNADGEPAEFTAGPGAGTNELPGLGVVRSVAVDSNGSLYVTAGDSNAVSVFAATGEPLTSFAVTNPWFVSVATDGSVYVIDGFFSAIKRFTPSSFPVSAGTTYSGGGAFATTIAPFAFQFFGLSVDPSNGDVYSLETNTGTTWVRRYDSAGALVESLGAPGSPTESSAFGGGSGHIAVWGEAKELADGGIIKLYLGDIEVKPPSLRSKIAAVGRKIVLAPPETAKTSALDVSAASARLRAWIDPGNLETTYRFEYGLEDCAVAVTPCVTSPLGGASIGVGGDPVEVAQPIFGLEPDTTYHYRVLAENSLGPAVGPSLTFTTQSLSFGFHLIDSRAWEMVSPADKRGAVLKGTKGGLIQAAGDGEGLAYLSLGTIDPDPQGNRAPEFSAILARRSPQGWRSRDIALHNDKVIQFGSGTEGEYKFFSPDLSKGIVMPLGATPLSPQASERTPYLREDGDPALYTPLLSGNEGFANVPPGTEFGGSESDIFGKVQPFGATPDLSHVVLRSILSAPLVAGFGPPFDGLYLWTAGQLQPISVLPGGEGGSMASGPVLGSSVTTVQRAISADGSRVVWGRLSVFGNGALYLRDTLADETTRLDVPQGGSGTGGSGPVFQGASADGTVVFFKDTRDLTSDTSPAGYDLYRCEIPPGSPATGCASLTNISAPLEGSGESAEVLGMVSGLGEDGTRVYFTATGVLDEAPNQYGESAVAKSPNLYLWEEGEGTRLIAPLDEEDKGTWGLRNPLSSFGEAPKLTATVSPGGRYLAFMSQRSLGGDPNLDEATGEPVQEVFRYDAEDEDLECISCNPFGAAPDARAPVPLSLVNPHGGYNGALAAATLPSGYMSDSGLLLYRARATLDNGRVFFNAYDSLVPADSNGQWDVYQWEPTGVGGCTASSGDGATVQSAGGCVSLLSSGTGEEEAAFLDSSEDGDDVFFLTPARLSVTDTDKALDVYDARVGGVVATLPPQVECEGEACRSSEGPSQDPTPNSATFNGPGNPQPKPKPQRCPKGKQKKKVKGKARCVAKKQGKQHKGKAGKNRGAGR